MIAKTLPLNIKITSCKGLLGQRTMIPLVTFNGVKMGYIRERKLKDGGTRYQAEIRLKGQSHIIGDV